MQLFHRNILGLLALLLSTTTVQGEQQEEVQGEQQEEAEAEAYYGSTEIEVCADSVIEVKDVSIVCDSPGTYYYGSSKYRNSVSCAPGDKAKVQIDFYIADPDTIQSAGGYSIVDVNIDAGWYTQKKVVYENADLCSLSSMKSSSQSTCPFQGYYSIKTQFYWDDQSQNSGYSFVPTVTVGFKSSVNQGSYDYGGANTNLCRGNTFVTWSDNVAKSYANAVSNFIKTFGILLFTIAVMGAFIWFLAKRPTSFADAKAKLGVSKKKNALLEDEFDFDKMRTTGNATNVDILDF
jgi:hypothetical protein